MSPPTFGFTFQSSDLSSQGLTFCAGHNGHVEERRRFISYRRKGINKTMASMTPPSSSCANGEKGNENVNSMERKSVNSNWPGSIPCHFEGSSYSSTIQSQPDCTTASEGSIKKEDREKREPSSQIVKVSRILKGVPHNPHFRPLKAYSKLAKQTMMKAWDRIFEETVDQFLRMQVSGFWVDAKRLWHTLEELQNMGYNVLLLRRRLVELTDILQSRRRHEWEIMKLKNEAEKHRLEKKWLEFEIVKLRAKVEAQEVCVQDMMVKVATMEKEMPIFDALFTNLAVNQI